MKRVILLMLIFVISSVYCTSQTIKDIRLVYVDFSIMTCFSISPRNFDDGYIMSDTIIITDPVQTESLVNRLLEQKEVKGKTHLDVRGKIIITYTEGEPQVFYFDRLHVQHGNTFYEMSDELRRQILVLEDDEESFFSTEHHDL